MLGGRQTKEPSCDRCVARPNCRPNILYILLQTTEGQDHHHRQWNCYIVARQVF